MEVRNHHAELRLLMRNNSLSAVLKQLVRDPLVLLMLHWQLVGSQIVLKTQLVREFLILLMLHLIVLVTLELRLLKLRLDLHRSQLYL